MIRTRLRNTSSVRPYVTGMHLHRYFRWLQ
ncbi:hypothetical protein NOGI109294_09135 [Nocardiopsis gilva]